MLYRQEKREQVRRYAGCGFGAAMVIAPFLALVIDVVYGVGVMVVALGLTAWLAWSGAGYADPDRARRLRILAVINTALAVAGVVVIVLLLT